MQLRPYQKFTVEKIIEDCKNFPEQNSIVVLPTASGKSLIIAAVAEQLNCSVLILQPTLEILQQNYKKLSAYVDHSEIGIYSASAKRKEIKKYTLATIGSIKNKSSLFAHFECIIIDECHLAKLRINTKTDAEGKKTKKNGMYKNFLKTNSAKIIGLTATPYTLENDVFPIGKKNNSETTYMSIAKLKLLMHVRKPLFHKILLAVPTEKMIEHNFLSKPTYISIDPEEELQTKSDYTTEIDAEEFHPKTKKILDTLSTIFTEEHATIVFCPSREYANFLLNTFSEKFSCALVDTDTDNKEREKIIEDYLSNKIKVMFNVQALTTGFDKPDLTAVVLLRPTHSLSLYVQMIGRGARITENKKTFRVYDFVGNVKRHGTFEKIQIRNDDKKTNIHNGEKFIANTEMYRHTFIVKR